MTRRDKLAAAWDLFLLPVLFIAGVTAASLLFCTFGATR